MSELICSRCAQECTAAAPPCGCGEPSTLMQPMCTRCWEDRVSLRALAVQLAEALEEADCAIDGHGRTEAPDVCLRCTALAAARKAGLIK